MLPDGLVALPFFHIGRLLKPLVLFNVGQYARLLAGLCKPPQSFFEGFTGSNDYTCHGMLNSPLFRVFQSKVIGSMYQADPAMSRNKGGQKPFFGWAHLKALNWLILIKSRCYRVSKASLGRDWLPSNRCGGIAWSEGSRSPISRFICIISVLPVVTLEIPQKGVIRFPYGKIKPIHTPC
jgi:hypothetical protein